jgi:hypothetical protein
LHVVGADVGIEVAGKARVTLFHNWIEVTETGVRAENADGLRLARTTIRGGRVGVSFGAEADGSCPAGASMANPGAVINGCHIEGARVGVAACDALPVLKNSAVIRNGIGVRLGMPTTASGESPAMAAPYDPCACAPALSDVRPGTAIFYSSGCHGCQVHEGWLPELRAAGHDIRLRASGPENAAQGQEFDAFVGRCLPQILDVIGVPGCVPNYGCLSNDRTAKVRNGDEGMIRETDVNSAAQLGKFAEDCAAAARRAYSDAESCVVRQLHDNTLCGNSELDIEAAAGLARWGGVGNACAKVQGWKDEGSSACSRTCPDTLASPQMPAARVREQAIAGRAAADPPPAEPAPAPAEAPTPPAPAAEAAAPAAPAPGEAPPADQATATADDAKKWYMIGAGLLAFLVIGGVLWRKSATKSDAEPS